MALASSIRGEEYYQIAIGQGLYTSDLSSNIPDGFSAVCYNFIATGDSLENRIGLRRPSVDWKVLENSPGYFSGDADNYNFFCQIAPWSKDSTKPAFMWGAKGFAVPGGGANSNTLNLVRAHGTHDANDGFISVVIAAGPVYGICQYNDVIYFSIGSAGGVQKITAINWATDAVTYSAIASAAGATLSGLFTFKDRLWGWNGNKLYFTDVPTVGGQPETWALATNVIPFVGPNGASKIKQVIPLGNRLAIFTTNGLFTLLVEGTPGSWILRILDSKSICTASQCAFESKGIIYYINTQGVWATNCLNVTKMSAVIEDQFFRSTGDRIHTINFYEDGLLCSIAKSATNQQYFDKDECKTFYSKLDPIAWTEWNINNYDVAVTTYPDRVGLIWSTTDKIPTYLNAEPTVYTMGMITDSTESVNRQAVCQLLIMDGGQDVYVDRSNNQRTIPVGLYLKTKNFDGGNPYNTKHNKRGLLEVFTSDAEHDFTTSWDLDATIDNATEVREIVLNDFTVGTGSNLVQIRSDFKYRRCAFNFRGELQTNTSQIKLKDMAIAQDTENRETEQVR